MDFENAKILLEKINALFRSMQMSPEHIASIEKDLMRNYIQKFYEAFLAEENPGQKMPRKEETREKIPVVEPVKDIRKDVEVEVTEPEPVQVEEVKPPPVSSEKKEEKEPHEDSYSREEILARHAEPTRESDSSPANNGHTPPAEKSYSTHEDLEAIFDVQGARELSEKLGQLPIPDLTKAFGLNEKIFTINELFGGNQDDFREAIRKLDSFSSFEEAKRYLSREFVNKYDWASKGKVKKAHAFVKVVRRRYPW